MTHYRKPSILAKIPTDRHVVIEASAGTGKTFTIEHLVVDLLLSRRAKLPDILVLTFTEKAAAELRGRIRALIERILEAEEVPELENQPCWLIDAAARTDLEDALLTFDLASIETIHSFFARILTEHAFSHGLLLEQELRDGKSLFGRAFKTVLREEFARDPVLSSYLTCWLEQKPGAIEELEGLLYNCHNSRREIEPPFNPAHLEQLLSANPIVNFGPARAAEAREAFKKVKINSKSIDAILTRFETLHRTFSDYAEQPNLPHLLVAGLAEPFEFIGDRVDATILPAGPTKEVIEFLARLRPLLVSLDSALVQLFLPRVVALLERTKLDHGYYDFDDMIAAVGKGLQGPGSEDLVSRLRDRFRFALIDEFQDTDEVQWRIFRKLFIESDGKNLLYLIGDPKQAIYGFRGADVFTYLTARAEVEKHREECLLLEDNQRSTALLIEACNLIFDQQAASPFFTGDIRYDQPVHCGRKDFVGIDSSDPKNGAVPVRLLEVSAGAIQEGAAEMRRHIGRRIAQTIRSLLSTDQSFRFGAAGDLKPLVASDLFILTSTIKEGIEAAYYLRQAGVPYAFYKQEGLFQTVEAEDIESLLAAILDPKNRSRRFKAWLTPFFAAPLQALPACIDLPETHPFVSWLVEWKGLADRRKFAELFADIVERTGLIRRELLREDSERELTNYQHIFEILLEESQVSGHSSSELLQMLQGYRAKTRKPIGVEGDLQRLDNERDAVQILTMHKSKGLQAAVVFVYSLVTPKSHTGGLHGYQEKQRRLLCIGANNTAKTKSEKDRQEEDQRLLYVALTRAKARLYLPYFSHDQWQECKGRFRSVARRLADIMANPPPGRNEALFFVEPEENAEHSQTAATLPARMLLADWRPDDRLLEKLVVDDFKAMRTRHAAFEITSYTKMKKALGGGYHAPDANDVFKQDGAAPARRWLAEGDLPGGKAVGIFLHALLEEVPFASFANEPSFDEWCVREDIRRLFDQQMRRNDIDQDHRSCSQALVFNALTSAIPLGPTVLPALSGCTQVLREMEFLFPYPEAAHPRLSELPRGKFVIERGFVKGFVDLVFEHQGLVYLGDWKSDILPDYSEAAVADHVQRNYTFQVQLYSLALVKLLGVHAKAEYNSRFGGLLYCFLRGMRQEGDKLQGVYFARPEWNQILRYEEDLLRKDQHGVTGKQGGYQMTSEESA